MTELIAARREFVLNSYNSAVSDNHVRYLEGDVKATEQYIFPNQLCDANEIVSLFYEKNLRVISILKKTKVGADGLMIAIAMLMCTHINDDFVVNPANVRIITGMSNSSWEKDMKEKAPNCFKDKIFHHGKLKKSDLSGIRNGLIIIDEIDTGDKEFQVLHNTLNAANILDIKNMTENNNRFVFISATMIRELNELYAWRDLHKLYRMTIPASYFGHTDFKERGFIQEFYPLNTHESVEKWVREDIIENYGTDYRVHIVRVNNKNVQLVEQVCSHMGVVFYNHTSSDKLTEDEIQTIFNEPLTRHIVLGIKGFFRRANLIPNQWKRRIGATHELYTKTVDNNVQIQGLCGRMTGYWRSDIENGHKTGPHRTSIKAIDEYEQSYENPNNILNYQSSGFKVKNGKTVVNDPIMLSAIHVPSLIEIYDIHTRSKNRAETVPYVFNVSEEEYNTIDTTGSRWNIAPIYNILQSRDPQLVETLKEIERKGGKDQIVQPTHAESSTYREYIHNFVEAHQTNQCKRHVGNIKDNNIDIFQIYLDKIGYRIIVSIYYGSKNRTEDTITP